MPKAIAQITIRDETDISVSATAPISPVVNQLWLDTSTNPSQLKKYNGVAWEVVNDVQVGGRNLLLNSNKTVGESATREFVQFTDVAPIFDTYGLIEYTISFDIKSKNTSKTNAIQVYGQNGNGSKHNFSKTITVTTDWQRKYITITPVIANASLTQTILAFYGTYDTGNIPIVRNVKIEKGNKATDWTPAPEDIDNSINEVKEITTTQSTTIGVMQGQITTAINNTQIVKDGQTILLKDDYNRTVVKVDSMNSTIGTHTSQIDAVTGKVTSVETTVNNVQRDLNGTISTVGTHTTQISGLNTTVSNQGTSITQLQNQISLKVEQTQVNTAINNAVGAIKIGSRNILKKSNINVVDVVTYSVANLLTSIPLVKDKKYTVVARGCVSGGQQLGVWTNGGSTNVGFIYLPRTSTGIGTAYITFTCPTITTGNEYKIGLYNYPSTGSTANPMTVEWVTMYEGEIKPSLDWEPAIEDTSAEIDTKINTAKAEIRVTTDSITQSVSNLTSTVNTKADGTTVSTLSNKVGTLETNLNSITSRVSSVETSTSTINGNITNLQSRMSTAESKITDSAIVNTIKSSQTDGKSTFAQTSTVEQLVNQVKFDFTSSGGGNLIANGNFKNGLNSWVKASWGSSNFNVGILHEGHMATPAGKSPCYIESAIAQDNLRAGVISNKFPVIGGENYTCSFFGSIAGAPVGCTIEFTFFDINNNLIFKDSTKLTELPQWGNTKLNYKKCVFTTQSPSNAISSHIWIWIDHAKSPWTAFSFYDVMVNVGKEAYQFTPNANEIYSGNTVIDSTGVIINNGALTIKNNAGTTVFQGDSNGNLNLTGTINSPIINGGSVNGTNVTATNILKVNGLTGQAAELHLISAWNKKGTVYSNDQRGLNLSADGGVWMTCNSGAMAQLDSTRFYVYGNLACSGTKSRVVNTRFGEVAQNAYETAECYFGDIGEGTIGEDGLCYIYIDPIMFETINTNCSYQVFLQLYNEGKAYISERHEDYFIVKGTPNVKFAWELKAKQKGYEINRLEKNIEQNVVEVDYVDLAEKYLQDYGKELYNG